MMNMMGMGMSGGFFGFGWLLLLIIAGYLGYRLLRRGHSGERTGDGEQQKGETLEHRIYRSASRHGGSVTVSELVVETGIAASRLESVLDGMVDERRVRMEVKDDGTTVYEFPELRRVDDGQRDGQRKE